jgi:carbonic anhydrase
MGDLEKLFENNRAWARRIVDRDPEFFQSLARQQSPEFVWIGCADSRVPANEIVGMAPGELFVHRNLANVVVHTDLNCMAVLQYALDVLKVRHVIVCGHYGCGGVRAALHDTSVGLADNWLRHVQDVRDKYASELTTLDADLARQDRLCELNVIEQVQNVAQTTVMRDVWARGQKVTIYGLIYSLKDGLLHDLATRVSSPRPDRIGSPR